MMSTKDYYKILGVPEGATLDSIKKAYRGLALKHHPDRASGTDKKQAEEKFKEISEAYYVLSDEKRRAEYDAYRNGGAGNFGTGDFAGQHGFDFEEILRHFGGLGRRGKTSGKRTCYSGGFDFEDIFDAFNHMGGRGGKAYIFNSGARHARDREETDTDIHAGLNIPDRLLSKGGEATFRHKGKELTLNIKPGTRRGQKLRLRGQGKTCPCCNHTGDLIITIS